MNINACAFTFMFLYQRYQQSLNDNSKLINLFLKAGFILKTFVQRYFAAGI